MDMKFMYAHVSVSRSLHVAKVIERVEMIGNDWK